MSVKLAVKKTIDYANSFGCHINLDEIKKRLISKNIYSEEIINKEILKLNWKNKNNKWKKIKIIKAKKLASLIKNKFRDVLFLGISGSVASAHPKKNDDIDLLIVTKANTLWKNRFFLRWWMYKDKIPHRKFNKTELQDQFCLNLWLDENYLEIPKNKQNLKNAIDLLLLKPLINKNNTYEKFILSNSWAKKYVATGYNKIVKDLRFMNNDLRIEQSSFFKKIFNMLLFWPQYWYMKPKITKEKIGPHQAFFHRQMIK
jgi:hypothetical protein